MFDVPHRPAHLNLSPPAVLDVDDAFSETEYVSPPFHFSHDALREDLAIHHLPSPNPEEESLAESEHQSDMADISLESPEEPVPSIVFGGAAQDLPRNPSSRSSSRSRPSSGRRSIDGPLTPPTEVESTTSSYPKIVIDTTAVPSHHATASTDSGKSYASPSSPQSPSPLESTRSLPTSRPNPTPNKVATISAGSLTPASADLPTSMSLPSTEAHSKSTNKPNIHRQTRSAGPSMFEKVMSKTRPSFLPPKPRQEDRKHLADWQNMMKMSQLAAEKRRKALQERRLQREKAIEDSIIAWQRDIVPDWRVVFKNPALRKMWWRGIPTKIRAQMWQYAVGNSLALNKDHYRICLARAKRAFSSGVFPEATLSLIEEDISTTLPSLHIFHHETGPLYSDLKDMLCAWVVSRSDEGLGYTMGAAKIAAMMLINMPVQQGFNVMRNLLERHCLRSFYGGEAMKDDVEAYYRIFDTLLADGMPKIYFNFKQHQISPAAYLPDWLLPLFLDHLPFEACARIWDVVLLEGDSFLYRAALGILAVLEPRLFFPDRKELLELLKGENKAAISVAQRDGRALDGGKYEIYGVDEETIWERIESMEDWWKESTWTRLIQRELPDI